MKRRGFPVDRWGSRCFLLLSKTWGSASAPTYNDRVLADAGSVRISVFKAGLRFTRMAERIDPRKG